VRTSLLSPFVAFLALSACGGNDDQGAPAAAPAAVTQSTAPPSTGGTINGVVTKGPVNGATVCAYRIDNNASGGKGAQIVGTTSTGAALAGGCAVTAADGSYSLALPVGTTGDVLIESMGGTYCTNEAPYDAASLRCLGTGGSAVALNANALRSVVAAPANGVIGSAVVTPFSTAAIANATAAGNLSVANFQNQFAALVAALGLPGTLTSTTPLSDATLQTILAALSNAFGSNPAGLGQALIDLAHAKYRYANGVFSMPAPIGPMTLAARIGASFKGIYVLSCTNADTTVARHIVAIAADGSSTLDDVPVADGTHLGSMGIAVKNGATLSQTGAFSAPRVTYQVSGSRLDGSTAAPQFILGFNADGSLDDTFSNASIVTIGAALGRCTAISGKSDPASFDPAAASAGFALNQTLTCTVSNALGGSPSAGSPKGASAFAIGSDGVYTLGSVKIAPADYTSLASSGYFQGIDNLTYGLSIAASTLNVTTGTGTSKLAIGLAINRSGRANTLTYANGYGSGYDVGTCTP
jgi:hypothetical protein